MLFCYKWWQNSIIRLTKILDLEITTNQQRSKLVWLLGKDIMIEGQKIYKPRRIYYEISYCWRSTVSIRLLLYIRSKMLIKSTYYFININNRIYNLFKPISDLMIWYFITFIDIEILISILFLNNYNPKKSFKVFSDLTKTIVLFTMIFFNRFN